jgi:hypothetical protein
MSLRNGALLKQLPMLGHIPPKSECVEPGGSNQGLTLHAGYGFMADAGVLVVELKIEADAEFLDVPVERRYLRLDFPKA